LGKKKRTQTKWGKEDYLLIFLIPSIVFLVYYGVFSGELGIEDALSFLTGLLSGVWVGANVGRKL